MIQSVLRRLRDTQTAELEGGGTAESGFTLIELMVVLLIIAILLAIAIPTFLGVTGSANDRATQSNLTNGLTEASAVFQANNQTFTGISAALVSSAPEFSWYASNATAPTGSNGMSVYPVDVAQSGDAQGVILASMSKTGYCWWVVQLNATPVTIASTGFQTAASGAGKQNNATTAGTYYAKEKVGQNLGVSTTVSFTAAMCTANFPESGTASEGAFSWGPSYSSAGSGG